MPVKTCRSLVFLSFKKGNTTKQPSAPRKAPNALGNRKIRLLNMKFRYGNGFISYVLRSACLTLLGLVYHKIPVLYTKNF